MRAFCFLRLDFWTPTRWGFRGPGRGIRMALDAGSKPALHCAATLLPQIGYPMLQAIREKTSGWIATVILGFLALLLIPFGINQYEVQRTDDFAARVEAPPTWWASAPSWWPASSLWSREEVSRDEF